MTKKKTPMISPTESLNFLSQKWSLTDLKPIEHIGYNAVFSAYKNQTPVILKIIPDQDVFTAELHALEFYKNFGAVALLSNEKNKHALLLECVQPGISLKTLFPHQDTMAVQITAQLIQRLHAASKNKNPTYSVAFKTLAEIVNSLQTVNKNAFPSKLLTTAKRLSAVLLKEKYSTVLHGDLHHENILMSDTQGWLAIDPKGIIGDPAYEIAAFMCNPMPELIAQINILEILKRRLALFSDLLTIDIQRLYEWSYVHAVLATCWSIEDQQDPAYFINVAETLDLL